MAASRPRFQTASAGFESPRARSSRELLGVEHGASTDELRRAYRKMAFLYHPDRRPDPDASIAFDRVRKAYEFLLDGPAVAAANRDFARERMFQPCVNGLDLGLGAFFGYRVFRVPGARVARARRLGAERASDASERGSGADDLMTEESRSILDDPAFDALETAFAGSLSREDEARLLTGVRAPQLSQLPWVIVNNQGLSCAFEGRFDKALRAFEELDRRVPGNIIFIYRMAICRVLLAFERRKRGLFGLSRPDKAVIDRSLAELRRCVAIGAARNAGRQRCLAIRKAIAEILEKSGRARQAARAWAEIFELDPKSVEAAWRSGDARAARALVESRARPQSAAPSERAQLNRGRDQRD